MELILPALLLLLLWKIDRDERKLNKQCRGKDYPVIYKKKPP